LEPLLAFFIFTLLFYLFFLGRIKRGISKVKKPVGFSSGTKSVTVVIPFRNEAANLPGLIQDIIALDIEDIEFEVVLVNDHSDDDWTAAKRIVSEHPRIKFIDQKNGVEGKKKAIELGVSLASGELILITDADCHLNRGWVRSLVSRFDEKTGFVAGTVRYRAGNSFFERFQALEFGGLWLAGAGLAGSGSPVICSAASMAFRKNLFFKVDGFRDNIQFASGDDEFLMRAIHRLGYDVKFVLEKESAVETNPGSDIKSFAEQRSRWASKSLFYEDFALVAQLMIIFFFYLSLIVALPLMVPFGEPFAVYFLCSLLLKSVAEYRILREGEGILYQKVTTGFLMKAEVVQIPYILYAAISGVFGGFNWKGREYKR